MRKTVINIACGLIAAALLVLAGWLATVPPMELGDDDGAWVCAVVLGLLALAIQPPVGRRYPWLIAGLCVLVAVSGFEALNYQAWHRQHRGLLDDGLRADVGGIEIEAHKTGSSLTLPGTAAAMPPLRLLSPMERAGVNSGGVAWGRGRAEMWISWGDIGAAESGLSIAMPTFTVSRAVLPVAKGATAYTAGGAASRYVNAGTTVIAGTSFRVVLPTCADQAMLLDANPQLDDGGAPLDLTVQPFLRETFDPPLPCPGRGKQMPVDAFIEKLKVERAVTMTVSDAKGRTLLTAVIPTGRLADALKVRRQLADRIRRGDVGEPFSPFGYYLSAKPKAR